MNRTTVSHYRILERLGRSGTGVICKAHNTRLRQSVALKVLPHDLACDEQSKSYSVHEAADDELLILNSSTTVMRYKITEETMPEIGGKLNINDIVEESILRDSSRVRIIAQLTDRSIDRYLSAMSSIRERSARQHKPVWHVDVYYNTPGGFP